MITHMSNPKSRALELSVSAADDNPFLGDRGGEYLPGNIRWQLDRRHSRRLGSERRDVGDAFPGLIGNLSQPFLGPGSHRFVPGPSSFDSLCGD